MPKCVAAIILNYNHPEDTANCIKNLKRADKNHLVDFFIVDNSPPNPNRGFAKGINKGIRMALRQKQFKYFLIINPDVNVGQDFFELLKNFSDQEVGIVAPAICHQQNNQTMYGLDGFVDWKYAKSTHYNQSFLPKSRSIDSQFVTFACVLISREVIKKVGTLDERYFMYCEDVDYCLTVKNHGFKIILDSSVLVGHNTSSSFAIPTQKLPISFRSQLKFIAKWLPWYRQIVPYLYNFLLYPYLYVLWSYHHAKNKHQ